MTGLWRKSSYSGNNSDCVEVAFFDGGRVGVRDSKYQGDPAGQPFLILPAEAWDAFTADLRHS